jgi:hypothetical protein
LGAPIKPKPACADGIAVWGAGKKRRALAFGDGSLPIALDIATLVSKRPTGLGTALTDAPELATQRGAEISAAPVRTSRGTLAICGRSRSPTGRVTGIYVTEISDEYKLVWTSERLSLPADALVAHFAVSESHYVIVLHKTMPAPSANPLASLFGRPPTTAASSPALDTAFGTQILLVPVAAGSARSPSPGATSVQLPNVLVTGCARASSSGSSITLDVSVVDASSVLSLADLADTMSGAAGSDSPVSSLRRYVVTTSLSPGAKGGGTAVIDGGTDLVSLSSGPALSFYAPAPSSSIRPGNDSYQGRVVSAALEVASGACGIAIVDTLTGETMLWKAGDAASGALVSRPCISSDGKYAAVLVSGCRSSSSRVVLLEIANVGSGPVCSVSIDNVKLGACVGHAWSDVLLTWTQHGGKAAGSAYEMFQDKKWNDIESGQSLLLRPDVARCRVRTSGFWSTNDISHCPCCHLSTFYFIYFMFVRWLRGQGLARLGLTSFNDGTGQVVSADMDGRKKQKSECIADGKVSEMGEGCRKALREVWVDCGRNCVCNCGT